MKLNALLARVPQEFVAETLQALPGPDRKRLLHTHGCRVKIGPATLQRKKRVASEAKKLRKVLLQLDDLEETRGLLQGWLARRGPMIIGFLDAWEVDHNGGFVEDFDWVNELAKDKVRASMDAIAEEHGELATRQAMLIYFAYLELPFAEELIPFGEAFEQASAEA